MSNDKEQRSTLNLLWGLSHGEQLCWQQLVLWPFSSEVKQSRTLSTNWNRQVLWIWVLLLYCLSICGLSEFLIHTVMAFLQLLRALVAWWMVPRKEHSRGNGNCSAHPSLGVSEIPEYHSILFSIWIKQSREYSERWKLSSPVFKVKYHWFQCHIETFNCNKSDSVIHI